MHIHQTPVLPARLDQGLVFGDSLLGMVQHGGRGEQGEGRGSGIEVLETPGYIISFPIVISARSLAL